MQCVKLETHIVWLIPYRIKIQLVVQVIVGNRREHIITLHCGHQCHKNGRQVRGQFVIPTGLYSDRSIFRQDVISTGLYSDRSIFRQVVIQTGLYSDRSIFRQVVIPTVP